MQISGCLRAGEWVQRRWRKWGVTDNGFNVLGVIGILIIFNKQKKDCIL